MNFEKFSNSKWAKFMLAFWAFSESIFFFILPDFLLLPLSIFANKTNRFKLLFTCMVSSFMGAIIMIVLCLIFDNKLKNFLFAIPYTHEFMLAKLTNYKLANGLIQAFSGIPAKVWFYWGIVEKKFNPFIFIGIIYISRMSRMLLICLFASLFAKNAIKKIIDKYWLILFIIYCFLFLLVMNKLTRG